ncbi:uncharacterized protein [Ptychodera flava]|uniref:uncharacterized protein n=1 Tax=Ptychodera flava TaxID=63121 RepID=UPI003969CE8C
MRSNRRPNWMSRRMVLGAPRSVVQLPRIRRNWFCFLFGGLFMWTALTYLCLSKVLPSVPMMFSDDKGTHLHGRSAGDSSNPSENIPIDMFAPLNMVNNEPPKGMKASNTYIFPILLGNQGLNNQLIGFKMSVVLAMYTNRTLVLAPFFDEQKHSLRVRNINEVVDLEHLRELLPTVPMEEFKKQCNGKFEVLFSGINMSNALTSEQYNGYLKSVNTKVRLSKNLTGIEVGDFQKEPGILTELPGNLPDGQHSLKTFKTKGLFESDSNCAGVVYPYGLMVRFYYYDYVPVFAQYLRRPPEIRQMADSFIWEVINSRNFLGIHWRFDDAWKVTWCKTGVQDQKVKENCNVLLMSDEKSMVARIVSIMKENSISSAYLSSPPAAQDKFIIELKKEVPNVYNRYDLLGISILGLDFDLDDNFRLSLLEQEICAKSALFIGSRMSAWTDIVAEDRNYKNRLYMPDIFKTT